MRILLLHQYFLEEDDPGGSRFNEMTKQWSEQGHEITVLAGMMHANGSEKRKEYKGKWFKRKHQGDLNVWRTHVSEAITLVSLVAFGDISLLYFRLFGQVCLK